MQTVEDGSNASTHASNPLPLSPGGLIGYYLLVIVVIMLPVVVTNTIILVALIIDQSTALIVRFMLGNIPVACLIVSTGILLYGFAGLGLAYSDIHVPDNVIEICRIVAFLIGLGSAARIVFMAGFSVTVYVVIRFNVANLNQSSKWNIVYFAIVVVALWTFVLVGRIPLCFDVVINDSCQYTTLGSAINLGASFLLYGVGGFTVASVFLILTVCFIRRNTIDQDMSFKKAMMKFAAFLLIGNTINCIGALLPPLIGVLISTKDQTYSLTGQALYFIGSILVVLSLIPTPILLIVYFKPVRMKVKILCCCCCLRLSCPAASL